MPPGDQYEVSDVSGSRKKSGMPDNLAIPLYAQRGRLKRLALPLLVALLVGSLTAGLSAVAIGSLFGASRGRCSRWHRLPWASPSASAACRRLPRYW